MEYLQALKTISSALSDWQKSIITKQQIGKENEYKEMPHPAAAPISTDQEAGGSVTTPYGDRKYDKKTADPKVVLKG